jgi:hypothetical protein
MNNETSFFILFGVICAAAGYFAWKVQFYVKAYFKVKQRKVEFPYVESAHQELLCKGPHSYERTKLALGPLPTGDYLVCKDCGFIANEGGDYKLNKPALEVLHNNIKRRDRQIQIHNELLLKKQQMMDQVMNSLIKSRIEKFDGDLHKNIPELQQFFRLAAIEVESLYVTLKKDLDDLENRG